MARPKKKVDSIGMKVNTYSVLTRAVEEGIEYGWRHAHKHTDTPDEDTVRTAIHYAIMNSIGEVFVFDDNLK